MIEAELFGYQRPEPNSHRYLGLYGAALGGSLFIDEICSLPLDVQETLAECSRRGGEVRIMASSSRDPEPALRVGQLRKDFIGLFSGRRLQIPPLRERRGDIALLVRHFIDLLNHRTAHEPAIAGIDDHALELMERYAWPGNVRELYEAIETAFCGARSDIIGAADLPAWLSGIDGPGKRLPTIAFETFADAERAVLERALEITGGNKLRAARLLKISRKKLYSGIAKYGIRPVETRSAVR